jgi:hypothetical protein
LHPCRIPTTVLWALKDTFPIDKGDCFTNAGLATLMKSNYSALMNDGEFAIDYVLGLLTPPNHEVVAHAWLKATRNEKVVYWDPTLQVHSPSWNLSPHKFHYQALHVMSAQELSSWLREKYPDRDFTVNGIPYGNCRLPIINLQGEIE